MGLLFGYISRQKKKILIQMLNCMFLLFWYIFWLLKYLFLLLQTAGLLLTYFVVMLQFAPGSSVTSVTCNCTEILVNASTFFCTKLWINSEHSVDHSLVDFNCHHCFGYWDKTGITKSSYASDQNTPTQYIEFCTLKISLNRVGWT